MVSPASPASGALLATLPAELLSLVPRDVHSAACVGRMAAVCKSFRAVCESESVWHALAFAHFPRLRALLQHMPQPHPPFRLLFRQQQRAERPRRPMPKPRTSRSDYVYTVELRRSAGGPEHGPIHDALGCKPGALMYSACGRLARFDDAIVLWEHADAPVWADELVRHHRNKTEDVSIPGVKAFESQVVLQSIGRLLEIVVFVTRPDGATFILYDAGVDNLSPEICDEFEVDGVDLFEFDFDGMPLPKSGACNPEWRADRSVYVPLRLRMNTGTTEDSDEGPRVTHAGMVEIRYLIDTGIQDDMDDDDVLGYLESYAPFE